MTRQKLLLLCVTLALIAGSASLLGHLQTHRKLGAPGVKTHALLGSKRLEVDLPPDVLGYNSERLEVDEVTSNTLPQDTSFGFRRYQAPDGSFRVQAQVVLMGTDRTSMHKPQFCLEGQGWHIDPSRSSVEKVRIDNPWSYDLPVVKLISTKEGVVNGQHVAASGIYVYWFVADDALSASVSGLQRMWMMASELIRTGVLQRWAYVSYFASCEPGQEEATFGRMKKFIAASVPQFQLYPRAPSAGALTQQ